MIWICASIWNIEIRSHWIIWFDYKFINRIAKCTAAVSFQSHMCNSKLSVSFVTELLRLISFVLRWPRLVLFLLLWWMNLTQNAIQKHIIYLMHLFSCFNFTVDSPLTKSIFGKHAVIISIHWIVMNLRVCTAATNIPDAKEWKRNKMHSNHATH